MDTNKRVVVIAGPSGSGESTITNQLIGHFPNKLVRLVTATSRPPREGEQLGVDYHFFSKEEFKQKIDSGEIIEYSYIENRDTYYGTYKPDLEEKLKLDHIVIVNPDLVGTRFYKNAYNASTIFIAPKDPETLERRIRARNPEMVNEEVLKRIANAMNELTNEQKFYDHTVINEDGKLEEAVDDVVGIMKKEGYNLE